jgi:uncharacterized membrane protein
MTKGRMEAFSDGVIAILITIMVLDLKIPAGVTLADLRPLAPVFFCYTLSFVFLGIYWSNHHHLLQAAKVVNGTILWANMHLLFWLSLVPFVTAWMGEHNFAALPVALYGVVMWFAGLAYFLLTRALVSGHGSESILAQALGQTVKERFSMAGCLLAILLSFTQTWISGTLYVVIAALWLIPDQRIERALGKDVLDDENIYRLANRRITTLTMQRIDPSSAAKRTIAMLAPHPRSALEYLFFKVNAGPVALIVDWIIRRPAHQSVMRVSVHAPGRREVIFQALESSEVGLTPTHTSGQAGDIRWALDIDPGEEWLAPDLLRARLMRMTDLALVSAPNAVFSGEIHIGGQRFTVDQSAGMVSHYWGRRLSPEWWWVSANQFDQPGVAVECAVFRSGLWGVPLRLPLAYLYLRQADGRHLIMSPPARARVTGTLDHFEISVRPVGGAPILLKASGREYGDFGEGITNTLVGDLDILQGGKLIASARGTAGLECRAPSKEKA